LPKIPTPKTTSFIKMPERQPELINGGMIMTADAQGYFRGVFLVNHIPMPFIIDTGAAATVIPADKALAIGLTFGRSGYSDTAGGKALVQATHIDSLRIGTAEIKNVDAFINPYIKEGLIGMNTLKFFRITYAKNTLTMVLSDEPSEIAEIQKTLTSALK
jgi:aspartyl protease family protein